MTPKVSTIICSHNPKSHYLVRTLDALRKQTLPLQEWELILVDNASEQSLASGWDMTWHPGARHLAEPKLGLTHARIASIHAARASLLVFFDDDNVPDPDYLQRAVDFSIHKPEVGVFGAGIIAPEFEDAPNLELLPYLPFIAVRSVDRTVEKLDPAESPIPCGAGLCVRATVALRYVQTVSNCPIRAALGRTGEQLLSGEDDEFSWVAHAMNLRHAVVRELRLLHLIESRRVQVAYMENVMRGSGYSSALLAQANGRDNRNPYALPSLTTATVLTCRLRILCALLEAYRWLKFMRRSPLERRLAAALATGWDEGQAHYLAKLAPALSRNSHLS